jgi:hypothetical protein
VYVFYTNPIILFYVNTSLKPGNNFKGKPSYKSLLTNEFPKLAPNYPIAILTTRIVALLNTGKSLVHQLEALTHIQMEMSLSTYNLIALRKTPFKQNKIK